MSTYQVEALGEIYTYRALTRRELREAFECAGEDSVAFEDTVFSLAVISTPEGFPGLDECPAGIPAIVCRAIMVKSGYAEDDEVNPLEERALSWAMTPQGRMDILISFFFPAVTLDVLDDMNPEIYHRYAVAAQAIAALQGFDNIGAFLDPGASPPERPERPPKQNVPDSDSHSYLF